MTARSRPFPGGRAASPGSFLAPVLALVLVLGLAGCGLFGSDDSTEPATTTRRAAPTTTTTTTIAAPEPELLESGAAPRRPVRLAFTPGSSSTIAVTTDVSVTQTAGGRTQTLDSPAVTEVITFTIDELTASGASISFVFDDVDLARTGHGLTDAEHADLLVQLSALEGLGGTATVTDRGAFEDFRYHLPNDLDPAIARQLRDLEGRLQGVAVVLPAAEIGVGASWRTVQPIVASGIEVSQTATYTVTELTDSLLRYTASIRQEARSQDVDLSSLPSGVTAHLTAASSSGSLLGAMALDRVSADATGSIEGDQRLTLSGNPSGPTMVSQHLVATTAVRPRG